MSRRLPGHSFGLVILLVTRVAFLATMSNGGQLEGSGLSFFVFQSERIQSIMMGKKAQHVSMPFRHESNYLFKKNSVYRMQRLELLLFEQQMHIIFEE